MEYKSFVNLNYKPKKSDLICLFKVTPAKNISMKEAVARVASESSVGTWTKSLSTETPVVLKRIKKLSAKVFEIHGNYVKIAYPVELFEKGNMPQILSSIAGNIFGMKAISGLRLEDIRWPKEIIRGFRGPQFGIKGIRKLFGVYHRPLVATVPKPKVGMTTKEHVKTAYEAWIGGVDLVKDDENLSSQIFNKFRDRVKQTLKIRDRVERLTGEKKSYLINITAETKEMIKRARFVKSCGGEYVMIDIVTSGFSSLQTLREECQNLKLAIHAHRAMHASFTRNPEHGISMLALSKVARLIGVDQLHIGTVVGKLVSPKKEVLDLGEEMEEAFVHKDKHVLYQNWYNIKPVFPVSSGGLHPGLIPKVMKLLGKDIILQLGGGIHGNVSGTKTGAIATRQAIDSVIKRIPIERYAKFHPELESALKQWHYLTPI